MRCPLSTKLALLLLAGLSCVLVPALVLTYVSVGESALRRDKEKFLATLGLVEERIDADFLHLNETKLEAVRQAKERLRGAARRFALLMDPDAAGSGVPEAALREELRREFIQAGEEEDLLLDSFLSAALGPEPQTKLGLRSEMTGLTGRTLGEFIANLPSSGGFGTFRPPGHGPMLVFFLPAPKARGRVVVGAISIQSLEDEAEASVRYLTHELEERFLSLSPYPGGFIGLLDDSGASLAVKGAFGPSELASLGPLLKRARAPDTPDIQESLLRIRRADGTEEECLAAVGFSRPFRWFTIMAAPLDEINAPSSAFLKRLVAQSVGIGLAALILSLFLLRRAIRPLRLLLPKLTALPDLDFSSPLAGAALANDLPLDRRDEVGDLARSFSAMGERLQANVRALMESAAAQERLRGELDAAREIQRGLLPPPEFAPNIFGLSSSALLAPAREVGGDLYYFFTRTDGRHVFVIGDVSGKGVPAALFMAITITLARHILSVENEPGPALGRINALLEAHNLQTMFVTLFLALYDPASGRLDYANGGHDPPCLAGGADGGSVTRLEGLSGPLVGVMPGAQYESFSRTLKEGELCLLFTDGITEAVNEAEELYGEGRLAAYLAAHGGEHPKDLLNGIYEDVKHFRGQAAPFDDITMLAFARR